MSSITHQSLFWFNVMLFSLCNTPAAFEWLMELVLTDFSWKICLICLDDVVVYGGNFNDVLDRLKLV